MKILIIILITGFTSFTFGKSNKIFLFCDSSEYYCEEHINEAFEVMGCSVSGLISCSYHRKGVKSCILNSENCFEPNKNSLFGFTSNGAECNHGKKVNLKKHDLSLTWTFGVIRSLVKNICIFEE